MDATQHRKQRRWTSGSMGVEIYDHGIDVAVMKKVERYRQQKSEGRVIERGKKGGITVLNTRV